MIAHLRGVLLAKTPSSALIECAGVGYEAAISVATFSALPEPGAEVGLHIFTKVGEDVLALYGFAEPAEKRLFEKLLSISGIGPKLAITVLSGVDAGRLVTAIRAGDHATIQKVPGIGKKTAERVVLELKDKLNDLAVAETAVSEPSAPHAGAIDDVISALINLGFPRPAAQKATETAAGKDPALADTFEPLFRAAMANVR